VGTKPTLRGVASREIGAPRLAERAEGKEAYNVAVLRLKRWSLRAHDKNGAQA